MWPLRSSWLLAAILVAAASSLGAFWMAITIYLPNPGPPPPVIGASPIAGLKASDLHESFNEIHHGHRHEAIDIMKPYGTPVHAVVDGTIRKLFVSRAGGTTIYQFDTNGNYCYYYAHLDRYAPNLREGMRVSRGAVIGFVGSTGNASPTAPHLHFTIFKLGPEKHWWKGTPVNPYPVLLHLLQTAAR